jgi:hypothetical protein
MLDKLDKITPKINYLIGGGQRTVQKNKEVGGSRKSKHLLTEGGTAIDVNPIPSNKDIDIDIYKIAKMADTVGFKGIITYTKKHGTSNSKNGRLHLDNREDKYHADKRKNSKGKSYYKGMDYDK